jgi:thymidylate synthase (FAD)
MSVKIKAITNPIDCMTPENFIVFCARVSNPNNQINFETSEKLLKYLVKHKHWSPFEHVSCTFEIQTSRAIAAQILRHRSFTFQEFSQRYASVDDIVDLEWRAQGKTNRQVGDESIQLPLQLQDKVNSVLEKSKEVYDELLEQGVARECARMVLPLATSTTIYMTGTFRSWIHYIELRTTDNTQKEHRDIAIKIRNILAFDFPLVAKALNWK